MKREYDRNVSCFAKGESQRWSSGFSRSAPAEAGTPTHQSTFHGIQRHSCPTRLVSCRADASAFLPRCLPLSPIVIQSPLKSLKRYFLSILLLPNPPPYARMHPVEVVDCAADPNQPEDVQHAGANERAQTSPGGTTHASLQCLL